MAQSSFTRAEAQAKVGKRVRARVAFAGIPRGAVGTIICADRVIDGYDVEVAWVWPGRRTPWVEWITRAEYEGHLIELDEPQGCRAPGSPRRRGASRVRRVP